MLNNIICEYIRIKSLQTSLIVKVLKKHNVIFLMRAIILQIMYISIKIPIRVYCVV